LRAGFTDERMELEQRKEGRMQWGFKGMAKSLAQCESYAERAIRM
jgi:hypothetical protein